MSTNDEEVIWRWFALHSGQRMQLVSFWMASTALLTAALGTALQNHLTAIAAGLCALGTISSVTFALLDARTRQLVLIAETMAGDGPRATDSTLHALITRTGEGRSRVHSYRLLIQGLEYLTALLFAAALVWVVLAT